MRPLLLTTIALFLLTATFAQSKKDIVAAISSIDNEQLQYESIGLLLQLKDEKPKKLGSHKEHLQEKINSSLSKPSFDYSICYLALEFCQIELITLEESSEQRLVAHHKQAKQNLRQDTDYHSWIWDDTLYQDKRSDAGLILDLLGFGNSKVSADELLESITHYKDNRLKYFALSSALTRNLSVSKEDIRSIAADDESRELLHNNLSLHGKLSLFPKEYNNQEELSKTDMVNWLLYPTELGRMPTEIKLIKFETVEFPDDYADLYLWKFKSDHEEWKEDGWMVGLSGAFLHSDIPTTVAYGYTFSNFSKLDEMTTDEHFTAILKTLSEIEY